MSLLQGQTLSRENLNSAFMSKAEDNYIFTNIITTGTIEAASLVCSANLTSTGTVNGLILAITGVSAQNAITISAGGTNQDVILTPSGLGKVILNNNVAIGSMTAAEKLDVTGNVKISGNLTDGTNSVTVANLKTAYNHSQVSHLALGTTSTTAHRGDQGLTAYNHVSSDGSSHTFINQDVTSAAKPTFAGINNTGRIEIATNGGTSSNSAPRAISWYNSAYKTWATYMAPSGATAGYNGTARTTLGEVTSWALVNNMENTAGYGWIWESGLNDTTAPTAKMALASDTGNLTVTGNITSNSTLNAVNAYVGQLNGTGYAFWSSDNYKIYMSSSADATYGGRLDSTSDYNMYFKMTGGTNRGFVFKNNTTSIAQIDASGNLYSTSVIAGTGGIKSTQSYLSFLTAAGAALPVKMGSLVVSATYADAAPTNGAYIAGNVGVGITPTEKLHVNGNLKVQGNITATGTISGSLSTITMVKYSIQYNATDDSLDFIYTP